MTDESAFGILNFGRIQFGGAPLAGLRQAGCPSFFPLSLFHRHARCSLSRGVKVCPAQTLPPAAPSPEFREGPHSVAISQKIQTLEGLGIAYGVTCQDHIYRVYPVLNHRDPGLGFNGAQMTITRKFFVAVLDLLLNFDHFWQFGYVSKPNIKSSARH